ncbi:MAG: hypothetical protein OEY56_05340 [Cyclobacteriaceae bacterium]|nr:hypothetical protein [Cyclobacteriaceae bacterium]
MKRIFSYGLVFFLIQSVFSQHTIELNESDVDMKVLTWHYDKYKNSQEVVWSLEAHEGVGTFIARFIYENGQYEVDYDEKGNILKEIIFYTEDKVPTEVIQILDYRVVKYKIDSFHKETTFENKAPKEVYFRVEARAKTGGEVVYWFDQDFNILPKKRDEVASR